MKTLFVFLCCLLAITIHAATPTNSPAGTYRSVAVDSNVVLVLESTNLFTKNVTNELRAMDTNVFAINSNNKITAIFGGSPFTNDLLTIRPVLPNQIIYFYGESGGGVEWTNTDSVNQSKFLWFPGRDGAIRAGQIGGMLPTWNSTNIGYASAAFGFNSDAWGDWSFAAGDTASARGQNSFSAGSAIWGSGDGSFTFGTGLSPSNRLTNSTVNSFGLGWGTNKPSFLINSAGDLAAIKGISYSWPTTNGATGQALITDGANLYWATVAGGITGLSNPTSLIGLNATNGSATTAMRSDASPPLDVNIIPVWNGTHRWTNSVTFNANFNGTLYNAKVENNNTNNGTGAGYGFRLADTDAGTLSVGDITARKIGTWDGTSPNQNSQMHFRILTNGSSVTEMTLSSNGIQTASGLFVDTSSATSNRVFSLIAGSGIAFVTNGPLLSVSSVSGPTINSLDGYIPVRGSATEFTNSSLQQLSEGQLVITNSTDSIARLFFYSSNKTASIGIDTVLGQVELISSAGLVTDSGGGSTLIKANDAGWQFFIGVLTPGASNTYSLGSLLRPFKDLFLGTNSLYLGTNVYTDNATSLLRNGVPVGGGGGIVPPWTNIAGVLQPNGVGANTNAVQIFPNGALLVGTNTLGGWGAVTNGETLISIRNPDLGEPNWNEIWLSTGTNTEIGYFNPWMTTNFSKFDMGVYSGGGSVNTKLFAQILHSNIDITLGTGTATWTRINPTAADGSTPYTFDTSIDHTSGHLIEFLNKGTNAAIIWPSGGISAGKSVVPVWVPDNQDAFVSVHNSGLGEPAVGFFVVSAVTNSPISVFNQPLLYGKVDSSSGIAEMDVNGTVDAFFQVKNPDNSTRTIIDAFGTGTSVEMYVSNVLVVAIDPAAADNSTPYTFDTSVLHTDPTVPLLQVLNFGGSLGGGSDALKVKPFGIIIGQTTISPDLAIDSLRTTNSGIRVMTSDGVNPAMGLFLDTTTNSAYFRFGKDSNGSTEIFTEGTSTRLDMYFNGDAVVSLAPNSTASVPTFFLNSDRYHTSGLIEQIQNYSTNLWTLDFAGNTVQSGNLLPQTSNTQSIGSSTVPWKDLFLSTNSLYLGTNIVTDNGTSLLRNGVAIVSGGGSINSLDGRIPVRGSSTAFTNSMISQPASTLLRLGNDTEGNVLFYVDGSRSSETWFTSGGSSAIVSAQDNSIAFTLTHSNGVPLVDFQPNVSAITIPFNRNTAVYHTSGLIEQIQNFNTNLWTLDFAGNTVQSGSFTTGLPSGGSVLGTNKFGAKETGLTITANLTNAVRVEINGTKYWMLIANETP